LNLYLSATFLESLPDSGGGRYCPYAGLQRRRRRRRRRRSSWRIYEETNQVSNVSKETYYRGK
jgi:hypothetical protein